jgi:2-dehydro-3-deoxyphosphogluconate aldolase/(4S)-4-hydroxy-2-oxoglutarate aldolase
MKEENELINRLSQQAILPLFFHQDKNVCSEIIRALYRAGVRLVEFTNRGQEALENFRHMKSVRDAEMRDLLLGAGTIKTAAQASAFADAGADFIISPGLSEEVGRICGERKLPWTPGCMTPSEIMKAEQLGALLIKLFPGSLLGAGFVQAIKELFPGLKFIPTGGVTIEEKNLSEWFASGVIAVGAGSTLIDKKALAAGDYQKIQMATASALQLAQSVKRRS